MSRGFDRLLKRTAEKLRPAPPVEPDMSAWTSMEQLTWAVQRYGLNELNRQAHDPDRPPALPEEEDALDARDAVILARRAVTDAAERLENWPKSVAAQQAVRETREALEKAEKALEEALRLAEEAKRQPPPPPTVEEEKPAGAVEEAPETAAGEPPVVPAPVEPAPPPEPKPEKPWWEERARWRHRGPQDYYWEEPTLPECIHEYDPLTYDDRE